MEDSLIYHKKYIKYKKKYLFLKQEGGKKIGQGSHGTAYDVICDNSNESLCYFIDSKKVKKIFIYDNNKFFGIANQDEFIKMLKQSTNKIAKIFNSKKDFLNEIDENLKIKEIYKNNPDYITLNPIFNFNKIDIYNSIIEYQNDEIHHIIYSTKCMGKNMKVDLTKFIIDILESIVILQKADYMHNDIKLDNIVYCDDKYKLIDWGAANKYSVMKRGSLLGTNPIRLHIMNWFSPKTVIAFRSFQKIGYDFTMYSIFIRINKIIKDEYDIVISKNYSKEFLYEKYKKSFDVFMLGMTIVHVMFILKDTIQIENYLSLVIKFVSLTNPVNDANEALEITKKHFQNLKNAYKN
jgi:serine/threonine protein kinase